MPGPSRSNRMNSRYRTDKSLLEKGQGLIDSDRFQRFGKAAGMASQDSAKMDVERDTSTADFAAKHSNAGALSDSFDGFGVLKKK